MSRAQTTISWGPTATRRCISWPLRASGWILLAPLAWPIAPATAQTAEEAAAAFPFVTTWTQPAGAAPAAAPAIDASAVYLALRTGRLIAVGLEDGQAKWSANAATTLSPATDGQRVFVASQGALEALDAASGTPRWRAPLPAAPNGPPRAGAGLVVVPLASGALVALRAESGAAAWTHEAGTPATIGPDVAADLVVVGLTDGRVVGIDATSGQTRWTGRLGAAAAAVRRDGDRIFAGSEDNFLYCLSAKDGRTRWRWRTGGDVTGVADLDDERVYFSALDNVVRALDRGHGAQRWKRALPSRPLGRPLLSGETLVVTGLTRQLQLYASRTGRPQGQLPLDIEPATAPLATPGPAPDRDAFVLVLRDGRVVKMVRREAAAPATSATPAAGTTPTSPPAPR